ncbi:glycoside hydrolase N-terminal domain-containing protein [Herbiconiux sp. P17]|uniref:glycosyl hydrolase family 95 catalytic domain-containing protein n=1 Tax=Herbiconiux wuyangfengii TaxID=3342794 RepID=UPI0035B777F0
MTSLSFSRPADAWLEALPLGNGRLGAMAYGGVGSVRFDLNDETVWSGSPSNEAAQPHPSAADAASLLALARQQVLSGDAAAASQTVLAMQSDYSQAYLPLATVTLGLPVPDSSDDASYRRSLDLASGVHTVTSGAGAAQVTQRTVVSAPDGVLVHVVEGPGLPSAAGAGASAARGGPGGADADVDVSIETPLRVLDLRGDAEGDTILVVRAPSDVAPTHEPAHPAARWSDAPGAAVEAVVVVRRVRAEALVKGGAAASSGSAAATEGRVAFLIATDSTFAGLGAGIVGTVDEALTRAITRLDAAEARGVDALLARAEADVRALLGRVSIDFRPSTVPGAPAEMHATSDGDTARRAADTVTDTAARLADAYADPAGPLASDPGIAALLFDYGRYLLVASSRPGGLPATLQGIWNDSMQPPWSSNYTLNINLQMNYWQAEVAALAETVEPLSRFVQQLSLAGVETAARLYDARGWVAHHNSDVWLYTAQAGARRGDASWAFWPMAGPWLVRQLWEHVLFGAADDAYLRDIAWPVIRSAAAFGVDWLITLPGDGRGTAPSSSPENTFHDASGEVAGVTVSSALDLQLLRDLFEITLAAAERVEAHATEPDLLADVRDALADLPERPALTAGGSIAEWPDGLEGVDPHHRHVSPLFFVYPGATPLDNELRDAATRFLTARGDDSSGWSLAWKLALWARLHRPDKVSDLLRLVVRDASEATGPWSGGLYPNLFAAHPPFQIDGNLGFVAAVAECLVQSQAGVIELLPAVPPELGTGRVSGLIARPGVVVDLEWAGGALVSAELHPRDARPPAVPLRIRYRDRDLTVGLPTSHPIRLTASDFTESSTTR